MNGHFSHRFLECRCFYSRKCRLTQFIDSKPKTLPYRRHTETSITVKSHMKQHLSVWLTSHQNTNKRLAHFYHPGLHLGTLPFCVCDDTRRLWAPQISRSTDGPWFSCCCQLKLKSTLQTLQFVHYCANILKARCITPPAVHWLRTLDSEASRRVAFYFHIQ